MVPNMTHLLLKQHSSFNSVATINQLAAICFAHEVLLAIYIKHAPRNLAFKFCNVIKKKLSKDIKLAI